MAASCTRTAAVTLVYAPDDTVMAICIFNDYAGAEESNGRALMWVGQNLAAMSKLDEKSCHIDIHIHSQGESRPRTLGISGCRQPIVV